MTGWITIKHKDIDEVTEHTIFNILQQLARYNIKHKYIEWQPGVAIVKIEGAKQDIDIDINKIINNEL